MHISHFNMLAAAYPSDTTDSILLIPTSAPFAFLSLETLQSTPTRDFRNVLYRQRLIRAQSSRHFGRILLFILDKLR